MRASLSRLVLRQTLPKLPQNPSWFFAAAGRLICEVRQVQP